MVQPDVIDDFIDDLQKRTPDFEMSPFGVWGRVSMIHELHHALVAETVKPLGLTFNEWQIIGTLYLSGPPHELNPRDLIKLKAMTSGGIANLLGRMEAAGLISRGPSDTDRREVIVTLTDAGRAKAQESLAGHIEQKLLAGMTEAEIDVLSILLRKLLASLSVAK